MSITLAELEREVARRVGPFYRLAMDVQVPTTANLQRAYFPALRSIVEQDLVTNLWLLRRGELEDGTPVPVQPFDRQRTVANYDPQAGSVDVDRPWSASPAAGEVCEFSHLDPSQQLRPAVLAGLRRTKFGDRFQLAPGFIFEIDLTEALPWLLNPNDVVGVEAGMFMGYGPTDIPFATFVQGGHVCLRLTTGSWGTFWPQLLVSFVRDHYHFVNGQDSTTGPTQDTDQLEVDLDYAASAGHIEAWHLFPARLQAAAAGNLQATRDQTALEFARQAAIWYPRGRDRWAFDRNEGIGSVVLNAGPVYYP